MTNDSGNNFDKLVEGARILGEARILRDGDQVTAESAHLVRECLQKYLQRAGKGIDAAARSMGLSPATLSQVMADSYTADAEKHIRAIDKWIEQELMREAAPKAGFVQTTTATKIYGAVRLVMQLGVIGVISGPSGCGKTMTLRAVAAETPGAVYYSIDNSGRSILAVLDALATTLRIPGVRLSRWKLFRQVRDALKDTGRLIMIDEAHKLAGRVNDDALHVLRDLHDATKCPMLWVGNTRIATYLRDNHSDGHDPIDQIYSRIGIWLDLAEHAASGGGGGGAPGLCTVEDIQRMFAAQKIRLTPDAAKYLASLASDPSFGCYRAAKHLVSLAVMVAGDQPITAQMLRQLQRDRLGSTSAEMVESKIVESMRATA